MPATKKEIIKIANLAKIKFDESQVDAILEKLNGILKFVDQLSEVNCSKLDDEMQYCANLHEREDIAVECDSAVMNNAPQVECSMFVAPKVVD